MKKNIKNNKESFPKFGQIMGINVSVTNVSQVLAGVKQKISDSVPFYIVTPNPELVLMAQEDKILKTALNSTEFSIPDGVGLKYASKFLLGKSLNIIPGRKLFIELIKLADENNWKVFFMGGEGDESKIAAEKLSLKYKNVKIRTAGGVMFNNDAEPATNIDKKLYLQVVKEINTFAPQLLIVGLQDPKEEKWVYQNYKKLNIGGAAAFGGTFRYVAGFYKLPPKWMEEMGLEWAWRLITQPYKYKRILNAFPIFPLKVFWYKVTKS